MDQNIIGKNILWKKVDLGFSKPEKRKIPGSKYFNFSGFPIVFVEGLEKKIHPF